jgi:hypothetical protein
MDLKDSGGFVCVESHGCAQGTVLRSDEHDNELSGSIKDRIS